MSARRLLGILLAVNAALIVGGWVFVPKPPPKAGAGIRVGVVFDIGGKNDKSFNESAWVGVQEAERTLGIEPVIIEPTQESDREAALRRLAARGDVALVIGVGYVFSSDIEKLAREFPNVKFAGVDYIPTGRVGVLPNLAGLSFREHEGSFLVGAVAGLLTSTKVVGFVGGMEGALIRRFEVGYKAGVEHVCPSCRVSVAYAASDPRGFADPPRGQQLASAQYDDGADIIYHAAGKTGDGVFAAARQRDMRAIGVDKDQFEAAPCCIVTSMVKRVDLAVIDVVKAVIDNKFQGGNRVLGLAEGGVGFVADERNRTLLPIEVVTKVRRLSEEIVAGTIRVPSS